jgi:PIN domain nuclease of toxin-antitoxin system
MTFLEEEKEQILKSAPAEEEENIVELITQWEMDLEMLEDRLNNPEESEKECQETVMQIGAE